MKAAAPMPAINPRLRVSIIFMWIWCENNWFWSLNFLSFCFLAHGREIAKQLFSILCILFSKQCCQKNGSQIYLKTAIYGAHACEYVLSSLSKTKRSKKLKCWKPIIVRSVSVYIFFRQSKLEFTSWVNIVIVKSNARRQKYWKNVKRERGKKCRHTQFSFE